MLFNFTSLRNICGTLAITSLLIHEYHPNRRKPWNGSQFLVRKRSSGARVGWHRVIDTNDSVTQLHSIQSHFVHNLYHHLTAPLVQNRSVAGWLFRGEVLGRRLSGERTASLRTPVAAFPQLANSTDRPCPSPSDVPAACCSSF